MERKKDPKKREERFKTKGATTRASLKEITIKRITPDLVKVYRLQEGRK